MIPTYRRSLLSAAIALGGLVLLASCEDPSGVGLTVIDFGETDPRSRTVPAEVGVDSLSDFTAFRRGPTGEFDQRFLAGAASDPLYGRIEATGYIDFFQPVLPPGFDLGDITEVILEFVPNYVFGDTTSTAVLDLFEVSESWSPLEFTSDTTLQVDDEVIATFHVSPGDTLVSVSLSSDWVQRRDSLLLAPGFDQAFHGFQLRPRDESGAIVGLSSSSLLRIVSEYGEPAVTDTIAYASEVVATGIKRSEEPSATLPELIRLQDNTGVGVSLGLRLDTLDSPVLAAGYVRVEADTLLLETFRPTDFVRPFARRLVLFGMGDSGAVFLAEASLDQSAEAFIFAGPLLNIVLQDMMLNRSEFDHLVIGFPRSPSTVNVAPIVSSPGAPPRAIVLISPPGG